MGLRLNGYGMSESIKRWTNAVVFDFFLTGDIANNTQKNHILSFIL